MKGARSMKKFETPEIELVKFEAMDVVMNHLDKTKNNDEFLLSMNG